MRYLALIAYSALIAEGLALIPPWADVKLNPCATEPNGWQMIYWKEEKKCYKVFQKGHPCPPTMELTPGKGGYGECNCPPGTAQTSKDTQCYELFKKGPCKTNEFFAPLSPSKERSAHNHWGACFPVGTCGPDQVFWAKERKCYKKFSKGPCPDGLLLSSNQGSLGECQCDKGLMSSNFWEESSTCYEHRTKGPCKKGQLFLTGGKCGCDLDMQEYYPGTGMCYQLWTDGPCKPGNYFAPPNTTDDQHGKCLCKDGYILWPQSGQCYRPYTRGPCGPGKMLDISFSKGERIPHCSNIPCKPGKLYFLGGKGCHKVGTQGPCPPGQVVLFQETVKASDDGISYLGMCGCKAFERDTSSFYPSMRAVPFNSQGKCPTNRAIDTTTEAFSDPACGEIRGMVPWSDGDCYPLYTQGPCKEGEWIVPDRGKGQRKGRGWKMGKCDCRTDYSAQIQPDGTQVCLSSLDLVAQFLNEGRQN